MMQKNHCLTFLHSNGLTCLFSCPKTNCGLRIFSRGGESVYLVFDQIDFPRSLQKILKNTIVMPKPFFKKGQKKPFLSMFESFFLFRRMFLLKNHCILASAARLTSKKITASHSKMEVII